MAYLVWNVNGLEEMRKEFQELAIYPLPAISRLEGILTRTFAATQAATHIITASLKLSGKTSSDFTGEEWSGKIEYGGPSAGINNPVDYAIYEQARGGDHDFMLPTVAFEDQFESAMLDFFDGKK